MFRNPDLRAVWQAFLLLAFIAECSQGQQTTDRYYASDRQAKPTPNLKRDDVAPAAGVLGSVVRTIGREPKYKSTNPRYCLLAIGPDADIRIWLVLDANYLYADCNGNGDLTEPQEKISRTAGYEHPNRFKAVKITPAGTNDVFELDVVAWDLEDKMEGKTASVQATILNVALRLKMPDGSYYATVGDEESALKFSRRPSDAPILHLGGPLEMGFKSNMPLRKRGDLFELTAVVGTRGVGKGTFSALSFELIPEDVHPEAVLRISGSGPESSQVEARIALYERWCGKNFSGSVRLPFNTAPRKIQFELSFPTWKEGNVKSTAFEMHNVKIRRLQ
jgi:hypothetical protein